MLLPPENICIGMELVHNYKTLLPFFKQLFCRQRGGRGGGAGWNRRRLIERKKQLSAPMPVALMNFQTRSNKKGDPSGPPLLMLSSQFAW